MTKRIYRFNEGNATMRDLLGGKGANLAEMASLGYPVPPGFTITTETCIAYQELDWDQDRKEFISTLVDECAQYLKDLREHFGYMPLLSVRSGARVSMPGMMDTVLNVGLKTDNFDEWKDRLGERAFYDSRRRLIQMYGSVVNEIEDRHFEWALDSIKKEAGVETDQELDEDHLREVCYLFEQVYREHMEVEFPDTLVDQLEGAVEAVFRSWNNERAKHYRKMHGYSDDWGTAVNIQSMVFGNFNDKSCSGVLFTRNPANGENKVLGEYLVNAQGEDVVAGVRTPDSLDHMSHWNLEVTKELVDYACSLEDYYGDMQDIEFTVQDGKLYLLQTRSAKRTNLAAVKVAHDLWKVGKISRETACLRVTPQQILALTVPTVASDAPKPHGVGLPAGGHVVVGRAVFSADAAVEMAKKGPVILIAKETTPDDIKGMEAAVGILTQTGGATSHAAVVARGMNTTCVVGLTEMELKGNMAVIGNEAVTSGSWVTLDGTTGNIWFHVDIPVTAGELPVEAEQLMGSDDMPPAVIFDAQGMFTPVVEIIPGLVPEWLELAKEVVKTREVVFNLTSPYNLYSAEDWRMYDAFGDHDDKVWLQRVIGELIKNKDHFPGSVVYSTEVGLNMSEYGYGVVSSPKTVADLMQATGSVILTQAFIEKVLGGDSVLKAMTEAKLVPDLPRYKVGESKIEILSRLFG